MKRKKLIMIAVLLLVSVFTLAACASDNGESNSADNEENKEMGSGSDESMDMEHSGSGEIPEDLAVAENPKFEVGDQVILTTDHMKGMEGAEATITGAYNTTAYVVSYIPSTGGERVTNHKWVIHEEIKNASEEPLEPGTEITLDASHMEGMRGVTAKIESAKQTTVYMVDYISTVTGEKVKNHKWVTESEISAE
ncbi:YdhK family protein [Halobacillus shinanisalinarum]|uniref:YdhK family protein n=1 Tax=Halobacillus shinanisalinarum TaxID=2932258 RepID=A0ABY4H4T7_9BACI|nr:YdhK family protein [Halobacillus shinanisalinarum]UOQ93982.1 YdhK family protein [Halobacillus shinanisalinarum]